MTTPKPKKAISRFKEVACKTCGVACKSGKRGLCEKHYNLEQLAKAKAKEKLEKVKIKKKIAREKKADSVSKLRDKLDTVFSKFIRLRDTDKHGVGYCIDCNERVIWKHLQCGHFMSRRIMSTRWDEQNCHAQKDGCNGFEGGRQYEYGRALDVRHGVGTHEAVYMRSRKDKKWTSIELKELIEHYAEKVKELLKDKSFDPWAL